MLIAIRDARPGDGEALASLHFEMGAYYAELAPRYFQAPAVDGLAADLDTELSSGTDDQLTLVAEINDRITSALWARLVRPSLGSGRQIDRDGNQTRLRIEYVVTSAAHRRRGVGQRLVSADEDWGRQLGAITVEATTFHESPLSFPFWTSRMGFEERSVDLRKPL